MDKIILEDRSGVEVIERIDLKIKDAISNKAIDDIVLEIKSYIK